VRLSRKQSVIIGIGSIGVFFILGIALLRQDQIPEEGARPEPPVSEYATEAGSGPRITLDEFHRSETRDGKKIWEVRARHGEYFPATGQANINEAILHIFNEEEGTIELNAGTATLHISGTTLSRAEAFNGVEIQYDNDITMVTDKATYDLSKNTISAPGHVEISGAAFEVSGNVLIADLDTHEFTLHENVKSILKFEDRG